MYSITSANSVVMLTIPGVFPTPVQIQGFAGDAAFANEDVKPNETVMGVDGKLSGGKTPYPTDLTLSLQADSPSGFVFEDWVAAENAVGDSLPCNATILIPGISRDYTCTKGYLTGFKQLPDGKKVLQGPAT